MSAILSDQFRFYNLEKFLSTVSSNSVYLFTGRSKDWSPLTPAPTPLDNNAYLADMYDQMISLKRVSSSNIIPVIKRINWESGITYDMYRPDYTTGNTEGNSLYYPSKLSSNGYSTLNYGATFYVMNEFYQVYKCLYNGESPSNPNGVPSTVEPTGITTSPFITSDGYKWKYMYTIPTFYVLNFINDYYVPVPYPNSSFPEEASVKNSSVDGAIDTLVVKNAGSGYNSGTYTNVSILGDGTGAKATIVVSNGQITSATVTSSGSGYTFGSIDLSTIGIGAGQNGQIEVIIPPKYGHGNSPWNELGAYRLMISVSIPFNEPEFPTDTSYRRIGLIANPYNKSTTTVATSTDIAQTKSIVFSSTNGDFIVGEEINQSGTNAKGIVVSWDSSTKTLKYYQDRFTGTYQNNLVNFSGTTASFNVTGFSSSVVGTPASYVQQGIEKSSGRILYIDNRLPVSRSINQTENIKVVVEF